MSRRIEPFDGVNAIGKLSVKDWQHVYEQLDEHVEQDDSGEQPEVSVFTTVPGGTAVHLTIPNASREGGRKTARLAVYHDARNSEALAEEDWPDRRGLGLDLHIIAMDLTDEMNVREVCENSEGADPAWAPYIKRFEDVYIVDRNLDVHYCSAEKQPQLWWVETRADLTDDCPDGIAEEIHAFTSDIHNDEAVVLMGWSTVNPYLDLPLGPEGDFRHNVIPPQWVFSTLEDLKDKEPPLEDPVSCDHRFMEEIISGHQSNALI